MSKVQVHIFLPYKTPKGDGSFAEQLPNLEKIAYAASFVRSHVEMKAEQRTMRRAVAELQKEAVQPFQQESLSAYLKSEGGMEVESLGQLKVFVDFREGASPVVKELLRLGVAVELKSLKIGDYVVSGDVAVERKRREDFARSLMDGRLFEQAKALTSAYPRSILLVEGGEPTYNVSPKAFWGAMLSLLYDFKLPTVWVRSPSEAAQVIALLARREQVEGGSHPAIREGKPPTLSEIQEYVVAGLPGVELTLARRLLEAFGSVEAVFKASKEELVKVRGVGEKLAEKIRRVVSSPYRAEKI